jgi:diguanylate cyclase (GGDEF)-like protein
MTEPSDQLPEIDRQAFLDSLSTYIQKDISEQGILGLLLIDNINLAKINHSYGFASGDQALQHCYSQLISISRMPDTVFRIGDHRFAFILPDLKSPAFISLAFNKIEAVLKEELIIDKRRIDLDIRIGIALNQAAEFDAEKTILIAEESLDQAKNSEKAALGLTQSKGGDQKTQMLEKMFAKRLKDNEFKLYYQPKINLQNSEVEGAEALLRWQIAETTFVSPQVAVEIAEKKGLSLELTKWVIHTAIRQLKDWEKQGLLVSVSVNVSANVMQDPELLALVQDSLAIWGLDKFRLTLEITESAVIDDKKTGFTTLLKLKQLGVGISIDDFGTGYSSLFDFNDIPANEIKIDKRFLLNTTEDSQNQEIFKIIIKIARLFGLDLVAEGIESQEVYDSLRKIGCAYGQGYHMSRPLPADKFFEFMQNRPPTPR